MDRIPEAQNPYSRRKALGQILDALPARFKPQLSALFHEWETQGARNDAQHEFFQNLRSVLNHCTTKGLLARREFLRIAGLITASSLLPLLFPERAEAVYNSFAFWKKKTGLSATYPVSSGSDPYWDYVVLLLNLDSASGIPTTVIADESNSGRSYTISNSPYFETTAGTSSPYSGRNGSIHFTGNNEYIQFAASSDFSFSGDFTVEVWVRPDTLAGDYRMIFATANADGQFNFSNNGTNSTLEFYTSGGNLFTAALSWTLGQWYHLAISRSGSTLKIYRNGTAVATSTNSATIGSPSTHLSIGYRSVNGAHPFIGNLADFRIYKGVAKYTADFTPPTHPVGLGTASDRYWGYCVLACPFENSPKDMSGKVFTRTGTAQLSTAVKKYGNASAAFDGSSYLQTPDSTDFDLANLDFTIECWVYLNSGTSGHTFVTQSVSANDFSWRFGTRYGTPNSGIQKLHLQRSGYLGAIGTAAIPTSTWTHVAVTVSGTTIRFFINGVQDTLQTSPAYSDCMANSSNVLRIGSDPEGGLNGYLDSLRITKGYARYTASFTPPAAAFPVGKEETTDPFWTFTTFLLTGDGANAATPAQELSARNTLSWNSASVSTTRSRFLAGSMSFSGGTNTWVDAGTAVGNFGSGAFTLEAWIYPTGVATSGQGTFSDFLCRDTGTAATSPFSIRFSSSSGKYVVTAYFTMSGRFDASITSAHGLALNAWHHVAVTRHGNTAYLFLNGGLEGTATLSSALANGTSNFYIGTSQTWKTSNCFVGNIAEVRVTEGRARYTQSFTPPTRTFATTPTTTLPAYDPFFSNVMLQMPGTSNTGTTLDDVSNRSNTYTESASVYESTSQSKWYGKSMYFAGTGGLERYDSDFNAPGSNTPFTFECWYNLSASGGSIINWTEGSYTVALAIVGSKLRFYGHTASLDGTTSLSAGTWYHLEVGYDGANRYVFVNGVLENTSSSLAYTPSSGAVCHLASWGPNGQGTANGYVNDLRFTLKVCRHTSSFPMPQAALPTAGLGSSGLNVVTSGLVCLLDAGAHNGSQTWKNTVGSPADSSSQSAYDFYLGANGSSDGTDPTFTGVLNGRTANDSFSFDGGDYFTLAGPNTAFINSLHKKNTAFTLVSVFQLSSTASGYTLFATSNYNGGSSRGIAFMGGANDLTLAGYQDSGSSTGNIGLANAVSTNQIHFAAASISEGTANGSFLYLNGSYAVSPTTLTYNTTITSDAPNTAKIGTYADVGGRTLNGRIYLTLIYNRALSKEELDQTFNALRSRFGL